MKIATSPFDDLALLIGRILIAVTFLPSGIAKVFDLARFFSASLAVKVLPLGIHLPFPDVWAVLAAAIEVGGPILILFGIGTRWAALLMVAFVIMASLTTHWYWDMEGPARGANSVMFYKNLGLIAGFLFLYAAGAGRYSWDRWRRRKG